MDSRGGCWDINQGIYLYENIWTCFFMIDFDRDS